MEGFILREMEGFSRSFMGLPSATVPSATLVVTDGHHCPWELPSRGRGHGLVEWHSVPWLGWSKTTRG